MSAPTPLMPQYILIDCLDSRDRVLLRQRFALTDANRTFTIGRSVAADVTLDDPHSAALHAALHVAADGRLRLSDLGSVNGIVVNGQRHHAASDLAVDGGTFQIGRTRLRVRTSADTLTAEQPDLPGSASSRFNLRQPAALAGLGAMAIVGQSTYEAWLGAPRDLLAGVVTSVGFAMFLIGAWVAVWALLSRVMQDDWRWLRHAAIILGVSAVTVAVNSVLDLGGFMVSRSATSASGLWIGVMALAVAFSLHLMHASGLSTRRAALIGCLVPAILASGGAWMSSRSNNRDVNHISANLRLYPPSLRLQKPSSSADFFAGSSALRRAADAKLKSTPFDTAEDAD